MIRSLINRLGGGTKEPNAPTPQFAYMSHLPLEIRQQIYVLVLGGRAFHLRAVGKALKGHVCVRETNTLAWHYDWSRCWTDDAKPKVVMKMPTLLLANKQIYGEAVSYLYSHNEFIISDASFMPILHTYLPSTHLHTISFIRLKFYLPGHPPLPFPPPGYVPGGIPEEWVRRRDRWASVWGTLEGLRGLRELYVDLVVTEMFWTGLGESALEGLLKPVRNVTQARSLKKWVLALPEGLVGREGWRGLGCEVVKLYDRK